MKSVGRFGYWVAVLLGVMAFWWGASVHAAAVNRSTGKDQGAYVALADRMARKHALEVDGARPPLYPALLTLARQAGEDRETFFRRARTFTVVLATLAWLAFLFVLRRRLRPATALAVWLALGFSLWLFYAPYVKAESLFFPCATASFLFVLEQIERPGYRSAVVGGLVSGVAQLLKVSLAPALWLFVAVQGLCVARRLALRRTVRDRRARRRAGATALFFVAFFVVLAPYLFANQRVFGRPFYNVNSDFYIWNDSWADTGRHTRGHGDRTGFPKLSPGKLPSAEHYFRNHDAGDVLARLERGAVGLGRQAAAGPGFLPITSFALVLGLALLARRRPLRRTLRSHWPLALYTCGYFAGYLLLDCWFYAINPGLRFVAALFGPALFVAGCAADRAVRPNARSAWVFPGLLVGSLLLASPAIASFVRTWRAAGW